VTAHDPVVPVASSGVRCSGGASLWPAGSIMALITAAELEAGWPLILGFISVEDHAVDEDSAAAFYHAYKGTGATIDPGLAFDAGLFHALRHVWWGTIGQRWHRILFALENEASIRDLVRSLLARERAGGPREDLPW
jgi:hypothetical protein